MAEARTVTEQTYVLPAVLDLLAAQSLRDDLLECFHREGSLTLQAADVERISTPCLEILMATSNSFTGADRQFRVEDPSTCFEEAMQILGLLDYLKRWRHS